MPPWISSLPFCTCSLNRPLDSSRNWIVWMTFRVIARSQTKPASAQGPMSSAACCSVGNCVSPPAKNFSDACSKVMHSLCPMTRMNLLPSSVLSSRFFSKPAKVTTKPQGFLKSHAHCTSYAQCITVRNSTTYNITSRSSWCWTVPVGAPSSKDFTFKAFFDILSSMAYHAYHVLLYIALPSLQSGPARSSLLSFHSIHEALSRKASQAGHRRWLPQLWGSRCKQQS